MLLLPQGFNSVPGKKLSAGSCCSCCERISTFHLSGPPNPRNPRETRTAGMPLLWEPGWGERPGNPGGSCTLTAYIYIPALSITPNLTRVNRNTQAHGKSLPTCTNTPQLGIRAGFFPPSHTHTLHSWVRWGSGRGNAFPSPGFLAGRRGNPPSVKALQAHVRGSES